MDEPKLDEFPANYLISLIKEYKIDVVGKSEEEIATVLMGSHKDAIVDFINSEEEIKQLSRAVIEGVFRVAVEHGEVEITNRSAHQIVADFMIGLAGTVRSDKVSREITTTVDFLETLMDRAGAEARQGNDEIAITFYALWFEHAVNATIIRAMTRKGYSLDVIKPLIRKLGLLEKAESLWIIAGLPPIGDSQLKQLGQILEFRNWFVHYKWLPVEDRARRGHGERLHDAVARAGELAEEISRIESAESWKGREAELIECLREYLRSAKGNSAAIQPNE